MFTLFPTLKKTAFKNRRQVMYLLDKLGSSKKVMITTFAALVTAIPVANADHNRYKTNTANFDDFVIKAKVVNVTPVYKYVTVNTPTEHCYKERATYTKYYDGDRNGRMLLGGLIGGVIGNNIGHGKSRKARAVVGALIGSQIGSSIADNHAYASQHTGYETRCEVQHVSETKKEIAGYDVSYRFRGRIFTTQMPYHPGRRIKLNVSVSPVIN